MQKLILALTLLAGLSASADPFFDYHDNLLNESALCLSARRTQSAEEKAFKEMYNDLSNAVNTDFPKKTNIEITKFGAYSTSLKNKSTGLECTLLLHDNCYSVSCD